jgi:ASCH domain
MVSRDRFARRRKTLPDPYKRPSLPRRPAYALSLKQPWAALLVAGHKTIEVRKWPTAVRGRVFIHAARTVDKRPAAWDRVPDDVRPLAELTGGLIGSAELTGCIIYRTPAVFMADAPKHRNDPAWFEPPHMYGFTFRDAAAVPFVPCKGQVRFFTVELPEVQ